MQAHECSVTFCFTVVWDAHERGISTLLVKELTLFSPKFACAMMKVY
jgi:hypothetical protein